MKAWQTWLAPYMSAVCREVNKWTQLFDATLIFIHMDLSAASESIVLAHLNHCQLLLPMIGTVLLPLWDKRKFRLVCEDVVWINTCSFNRQNKCGCALDGKFQVIIFCSHGLFKVISFEKMLYFCYCGWCSVKVNVCYFSFYSLWHVAETLHALRAQLWW